MGCQRAATAPRHMAAWGWRGQCLCGLSGNSRLSSVHSSRLSSMHSRNLTDNHHACMRLREQSWKRDQQCPQNTEWDGKKLEKASPGSAPKTALCQLAADAFSSARAAGRPPAQGLQARPCSPSRRSRASSASSPMPFASSSCVAREGKGSHNHWRAGRSRRAIQRREAAAAQRATLWYGGAPRPCQRTSTKPRSLSWLVMRLMRVRSCFALMVDTCCVVGEGCGQGRQAGKWVGRAQQGPEQAGSASRAGGQQRARPPPAFIQAPASWAQQPAPSASSGRPTHPPTRCALSLASSSGATTTLTLLRVGAA